MTVEFTVREARALNSYRTAHQPEVKWCSVSCTCETCLDLDAIAYYFPSLYNDPNVRKGLTNDLCMV